MAGKAEIIIGVINDGATVGSGATAISDQFIVNNQGMELVSQTAQTGAVIANITSVTKLAGPYVPIISMPGNIIAGTITFLKVGVDIREGREISPGDMLSLVGNVAGIIGTFAILVGAASGFVAGVALVSTGTGLLSIIKSETLGRLMKSAGDFFSNNSSSNYLGYFCAPDMRFVDRDALRWEYSNMMLACILSAEDGELLPHSVVVPDKKVYYEGGGSGEVGFGGGSVGNSSGAMSVSPSPHNVGNVGISIIVGGNTYDAGDQYGCCTGTSDGYI